MGTPRHHRVALFQTIPDETGSVVQPLQAFFALRLPRAVHHGTGKLRSRH